VARRPARDDVPLLPEGLRDALDDAAERARLPTSRDTAALARGLSGLSGAYNVGRFPGRPGGPAWTPEMRAARLHFFLPRDARKVAAALRDVPLRAPGAPLRILDLGAGLGASALGALVTARARGHAAVRLDLLDPQAGPLADAAALLRTLDPEVSVHTRAGALEAATGTHDLVVMSNVLVEADARDGDARVTAARLRALACGHLAPDGVLLVVEPALRPTARRLQAVRDLLRDDPDVRILGPCTHAGRCPLLSREDDWCHDDLALDLPPWLAPVARAAGLRWQGLTFSRLVLGRSPHASAAQGWRVVAPPAPTRGKHTLRLCGPGAPDTAAVERLDRAATPQNAAWDEAERGDALDLPPEVLARTPARVEAPDRVRLLRGPPQRAGSTSQTPR
jgi:ribosomal protein RSM22 (predicted rRNA methylase)